MSTPPPPNPLQPNPVPPTPVQPNPLPIPMQNPFLPPPPTQIQPLTMPGTAVTMDDLLRIMQGMLAAQAQQFAQILQQAVQPQVQLILATAPVPAPPPSTNKKIRPTLPKYDGKMDVDDHIDQFVAIANTEHWTNDDRKQNFYKTLVKTASTWYVRSATEIEAGTWEDEQSLFLDFSFSNLHGRSASPSHDPNPGG